MFKFGDQTVSRLSMGVSAVALAMLSASAAQAAENGLQRYSPGIGGSDMTAPLSPGWYMQMPMVAYHAKKLKGNDGNTATMMLPAPLSARATQTIDASTYALLPRLTYLDTKRVLGANIGLTAMLPLVKRKAAFGGFVPGASANVNAQVAALFAAKDGSEFGIGDVEISPVMHWEIGDHQSVTFAPTLVLPTGDYNVAQRVNPGYGNFITFRPSVQYAFIGDGWDVGGRAVLSFNTRNKDNGYYSGNMFNFDYQLMKFISEDVRLGLQGYFVRQLSNDTQDLRGFSAGQQVALATTSDLSTGNKASVNAAGPAVAWLPNGGEYLLEGKFLKEFGARNRTEGHAWWLTFSKPL